MGNRPRRHLVGHAGARARRGRRGGAPRQARRRAGAAVVGRIEAINAWQLRIPAPLDGDAFVLATDFLGEQEGVRAISPDVAWEEKGCADDLEDADYAKETGAEGAYSLVDAAGGWDAWYAARLPREVVHAAVVDTAITAAPAGRPYEFDDATFTSDPVADPAGGPYDGFTHADGVMGILAADQGDGGIAGIASPLGGSLVLSHYDWTRSNATTTTITGDGRRIGGGRPTFSTAMVDTLTAINAGATVINLSVGPTKPGVHNAGQSAMWRELARSMADAHPEVLFVVAAGNEAAGLDGRNYGLAGIRAPNVITVGNVTNANAKVTGSGGSNFLAPKATAADAEVTIAAPGDQSIWGTGDSGALMRTDNGTSSATPMVAATAALVRSLAPGLSAAEIKSLIVKAAQTGPADLGGKTLSVAAAIRDAVDQGRIARGEPPLSDEEIAAVRALCRIAVTGTPLGEADAAGNVRWAVAASLDVVPAPTALSLTIRGGLRPADWRKPIGDSSDLAAWELPVPPDGLPIVVTRLDIGFSVRRTLAGTPLATPEPAETETPAPPTDPPATERPAPTPPPARPTPTPGGTYDCSNPPKKGTIKYVEWSLHCSSATFAPAP